MLPLNSSSLPKRPCPGDAFVSGEARVSLSSSAMDRVLASLFGVPDPSVSINLSFERIFESTTLEAEKEKLIDSATQVASAIMDSAMRSAKKSASAYNATSWPLTYDLTIRVFSMLDTRSLCHAAAVCSMFNRCAGDPLCYSNIDLTAKALKINNTVVSTMIQRAGMNLLSLKLGILPNPTANEEASRPASFSSRNFMENSSVSWCERRCIQGKESCMLNRSCLLALSADNGIAGARLMSLHLYNIDKIDGHAFDAALSACCSLFDLEVIGLHVTLRRILDTVSRSCPFLQHLFVESSVRGSDNTLRSATCVDLVNGCSHIKSLALRGFILNDHKARILLTGLAHLESVDFSTSHSITGGFLRNVDNIGSNTAPLQELFLRDCMHLLEVDMVLFLTSIIAGDFQHLRHLDISCKTNLVSRDRWNVRTLISLVLEKRPDLCLLSSFPCNSQVITEKEMSRSPSYHGLSDGSYGSYLSSGSEGNLW